MLITWKGHVEEKRCLASPEPFQQPRLGAQYVSEEVTLGFLPSELSNYSNPRGMHLTTMICTAQVRTAQLSQVNPPNHERCKTTVVLSLQVLEGYTAICKWNS